MSAEHTEGAESLCDKPEGRTLKFYYQNIFIHTSHRNGRAVIENMDSKKILEFSS